MTSPRHLRGTDFCEEKKKNQQQIIAVNLQFLVTISDDLCKNALVYCCWM